MTGRPGRQNTKIEQEPATDSAGAISTGNVSVGTAQDLALETSPLKSTIARAYGLIPDRYLAEVHRRVICEISAGSVAGDSTGYSDSGFVRWYDVRTDSVKTKRGWVKLHSIIDIQTRVVLDYLVTASNVADIIGLRSMLARFEGGAGHFCLDSAYLARDVCSAISKMGMVPRIKPKSNTIHNAARRGARW